MPPLIVTDSSYEFVPPHEGTLWPKLLSRISDRIVRKEHKVTEIEVRGAEKITELQQQGHGLIIAPNHCRMSDALVLQRLSRSINSPFFVMASAHLFRGSRFQKFLLRRIGAFSVYREGVDRRAVETAIDILVKADRPLVLFPEGALSQANDRLNALMEGVSFIARTAARKVEKENKDTGKQRAVHVVPVAIRYVFQGDLAATVNPILADIEQRLTWRVQENQPIIDRVYKIGYALLGLKETEYLGQPGTGELAERLENLIDKILGPLETEWLDGEKDGSVIARVKELRKAVVPDMIHGATDEPPLSKDETDRRWLQLEDMALAQALSLFPERYVASNPTVDRVLETVERMAENVTGEEQAHGPTKAIITVGDPFAVASKRDRSATADPVLAQLEVSLNEMLAATSNESRPLT